MHKSQKTLRFKPLASRYALAKARAAAGIPPRRRGAQPGNTNRLCHGRYTRIALARRAYVSALASEARAVAAEGRILRRIGKILRLLDDVGRGIAFTWRIETRRAIRDAYANGVFGYPLPPLRRPRGASARCIAENWSRA